MKPSSKSQHIHFVTGRLAERALRRQLNILADEAGFHFSVGVLPITVAALMSTRWVLRHLNVPEAIDLVLLPGYCQGDLAELEQEWRIPVQRGPRDQSHLPKFFWKGERTTEDYGDYTIEIIADINHAPQKPRKQIVEKALQIAEAGADVIDEGSEPREPSR